MDELVRGQQAEVAVPEFTPTLAKTFVFEHSSAGSFLLQQDKDVKVQIASKRVLVAKANDIQ